MKLEIAAGDRPTPGYWHHDARALDDIELVCDMWDLPGLLELRAFGGFEEVRATHILEHFSHYKEDEHSSLNVLRLWRCFLRPGGQLYVEVPNGAWQVKAAASGEIEFSEFVRLAYGDQDYPGNTHFTSFSPDTLHAYLVEAGFVDVQVQDIGMVLCAWATRGE